LPNSRILVTAQSNAACNELTHRLLKWLPADDIYRLFTPSMEKKFETVDDELLAISNLKYGQHQYPSWKDFYKLRIVVCTLTTGLYIER
jgi:helicase MOV-10